MISPGMTVLESARQRERAKHERAVAKWFASIEPSERMRLAGLFQNMRQAVPPSSAIVQIGSFIGAEYTGRANNGGSE